MMQRGDDLRGMTCQKRHEADETASDAVGPRLGRREALVAVGAAVTGTATGNAAADSRGAVDARSESDPTALSVQEIDADRTRIRIDLQADGTGAWRVEFWTRLDDEDSETAFEEIEAEIEEDPAPFLDRFEDRMQTTVDTAVTATGREMTVREFAVTTERRTIPESFGVLSYTFEWTAFAVVENGTLVAGDAIDGLLLGDGGRLTISWPEEYSLESAEPTPDDRSEPNRVVVWFGSETEFLTGQPRVRVTTGDDGLPWLLLGSGLGVLAVVAGGLYWLWKQSKIGSDDADDPGGQPAASDDTSDAANSTTDAASSQDGQSAAPAGESDTSEPPSELLSNEEQVLQLLEQHGGRMKQQAIVSELDWTEAKTSKVVTGLREDDEVEVFRIGRENVVALPEEADI